MLSRREKGATSFQLAAIMVPVLFAFIGFAVDLGRLYLIRGELQTAANSMALAAASQLNGTETSTAAATRQAQLTLETANGAANKYDFGGRTIGSSDGFLSSEVLTPEFYDSLASASSGGGAGSGTSKYVRIHLRAEAPLLFFGFLPIAFERKTPIEVASVAGISAPLCTACAIEPIAVPAIDAGDTTHFGFVPGRMYTFGYLCTGAPIPGSLTGSDGGRIPYILLNRYNDQATVFFEESQQAYRNGAQGMPPSTSAAMSCMTVAADETLWVNAAPLACNTNRVNNMATAFVCGLASRLDSAVPAACTAVVEVDTLLSLYQPDTDIAEITDYTAYAGSNRRILTVAIVETLNSGGPMQPLGFRQFLLEPDPNSFTLSPGDSNARFRVLYLGSVYPVKQGRFDGCQQTAGPGKAVLHQ